MKIPKKMKGTNVIVAGRYAVFASSLLKASPVFTRLAKKEQSTGIPCMGKITVKGKSFYWCRYGFLNDPDIYTK